jgi:hypothetical protein
VFPRIIEPMRNPHPGEDAIGNIDPWKPNPVATEGVKHA